MNKRRGGPILNSTGKEKRIRLLSTGKDTEEKSDARIYSQHCRNMRDICKKGEEGASCFWGARERKSGKFYF